MAGPLSDIIGNHFGVPSPGSVNDKLISFYGNLYTGSGTPEGVLQAPVGSFYFDLTNGVVYGKVSGASTSAGWAVSGRQYDYAAVLTSESTTSTSFVDLTTPGPAVTMTVPPSGKVLIIMGSYVVAATGNWMEMVVALSGANTVAAGGANGGIVVKGAVSADVEIELSRSWVLTGLTPGSTTFTCKYKTSSGGTATFIRRTLYVIGLP